MKTQKHAKQLSRVSFGMIFLLFATGWNALDDLVHGFFVGLASDQVLSGSELQFGQFDSSLDGDDCSINKELVNGTAESEMYLS